MLAHGVLLGPLQVGAFMSQVNRWGPKKLWPGFVSYPFPLNPGQPICEKVAYVPDSIPSQFLWSK